MNPTVLAIIGLTAIVAALVGVLILAVLRFAAAARDSRRSLSESTTESAFVTAALHEALTKLKAQEREMSARAEASERLSSEIVESLSSGLLVVGSDSRLRILNPAGRKLLHLPEATLERTYRELLPPPLALVIEECLNAGKPIIRRQLCVGPAGSSPGYLGVSVSPLSDEQGEPHGVICLFTDLTPVVEMEEQLRLKESLAQVGELTAGIAHEFRNGLATIHGYSRLIDLNVVPASFHPHVLGIRQETEALGEVVTNFLNFARPAQLTLSPVDLRAIAERTAEELRNDARAHGGDVTIRGEFPVIQGDDVLLRQAFSNLLRNAVEACVDASIAPEVVIDGKVEAGNVRVTVDDNGPGVAPEDRERIFRPFVTTKGRGTGLGLALVQKIIVTHNGRIQVMTSASGGASFQVVLPMAPVV
ncbi:MAG TPA: ATP-binding protein [Vicinamibacterales bacterium]|nr:ATP-binding protein [Vicinamibacterales bacterium]